jgi:pimeloyl-ACP methyl ester carboxylesterase
MSPIKYGPIPPHAMSEALRELRLPLDALGWLPAWFGTLRGRATEQRSVILLPGYGTGPRSMRMMENYLRHRGHRVRDWGLGRNTGEATKLRARLVGVVEAAVAEQGGKVVLVGWSLGGYLAREYAREHPDQVQRVITLGSPVIGGPRYTATARRYVALGHDLDEIEQAVANRYATDLCVPVTALYSKRDGIVAWRACIDQWSREVRHVEVDETHLGLVLSPRVLRIVAQDVERPDG